MLPVSNHILAAAAGDDWRRRIEELKLCPGMSVLVYYPDDKVWHERFLVFPISLTSWAILTPDGDFYIEDYRLDGRGDITRLTSLGVNNEIPPNLRGAMYRFNDYPSQDKYK